MNHIDYEQWVLYVSNELDDDTREAYEEHMFTCDQCLELYVKAVESYHHALPKLSDDFTDQVVDHVTKQTKPRKKERKPQVTVKKSFLHYAIAAAMTIILMSSGLFGQLIQVTSEFEAKSIGEQNESITEQLMDKTVSFIRFFEKNKEVE